MVKKLQIFFVTHWAMMTENYISPKLGAIQVTVQNFQTEYFVLVQKFKHNTLRGDSYWVAVNYLCRRFKTKLAAENYAERVRQQES